MKTVYKAKDAKVVIDEHIIYVYEDIYGKDRVLVRLFPRKPADIEILLQRAKAIADDYKPMEEEVVDEKEVAKALRKIKKI